jgi:hypothetical protein
MKHLIDRLATRPSGRMLALGTGVAFAGNQLATAWLNQSQAASKLPVPYYVAQLSFSPSQLKAWYAGMLQQGTLDVYLRTQHIDFLFILSTLALHVIALLWLSRAFAPASRLRRWLVAAACVSAIAPLADACENLVCYAMLAHPLDFADPLAYLYSSCSAVKFAFFVFAYAAGLAGALAAVGVRVRKLLMRTAPELV